MSNVWVFWMLSWSGLKETVTGSGHHFRGEVGKLTVNDPAPVLNQMMSHGLQQQKEFAQFLSWFSKYSLLRACSRSNTIIGLKHPGQLNNVLYFINVSKILVDPVERTSKAWKCYQPSQLTALCQRRWVRMQARRYRSCTWWSQWA